MPDDAVSGAGIMIPRNPGVTCLWNCRGYELVPDNGSYLFRIANPAKVEWWTQGRRATKAEVVESINTGLPTLLEMARSEGVKAVDELNHAMQAALRYLPG